MVKIPRAKLVYIRLSSGVKGRDKRKEVGGSRTNE
jgi:hypothetical protein